MFTIKSLRSGKNAVYVKNDARGRNLVSELLYANEGRLGKHTSLKVKPLTSGKIAIYIENSMLGRELVSTALSLITANPTRVPYALGPVEDEFDGMEFEDDEFDDDIEEAEFDHDAAEVEALERFEMKCCTKCGQWKGLDSFYRQRDGLYGRRGDCIECYKHVRTPTEKAKQSSSEPVTVFLAEDGSVYATYKGEEVARCSGGSFDENYQMLKKTVQRVLSGHKIKLDASAFGALCEGLPY
ncbi:hypothetical protein [Brevibacillus borstelensis]|uniref:hypothetical protein n=1 Tax=Brevibacillus borstelensis TaxID=45462 RepID=UPI000467F858|nr:hypothetical protein [Brevibacillus borstelensis]MCC0566542.1 hypothetical protein [Brevibacillus borstelensis]MCM3473062.1 hypothetical protein [Brevibacillus borstelensis]MCM3561688.1 hypothetical protein [Brevibacillus borstelensis]MED1852990.1 hypothetical protein [Brevibacillus borstelensis]